MAGVKGRSGGARPGAGRKRKATIVEQASRRSVVLDVIGEAEWRATVKAWLALAQDTPSVLYPLLPYLMGSPKQEIEHSGEIDHKVTQVETIRRALGLVS